MLVFADTRHAETMQQLRLAAQAMRGKTLLVYVPTASLQGLPSVLQGEGHGGPLPSAALRLPLVCMAVLHTVRPPPP